MSKVKKILTLCVLMTLPIALFGCSGDKAKNSEIVVGVPQDLEDSLDPHKAEAAGTKEILFNVYEGLLKPDSEGNNIPAVAESYTVTDDGLKYSFKLRENVKFHDGSKVTAEDVKYSIEKFAGLDGGTIAPANAAFSIIKEVNIVDDKNIDIILSTENNDLPTYLAMTTAAIIPAGNDNPDQKAIGTGPYKYVSRSPQENVIMESFDDYWGEKAEIKKVTFKIVADSDAIVMNLLGGSIDMYARLTVDQVAQLSDEYEVYEGTMNLVQALYLNNAVAPFDNEKVRQALSYATDVEEILQLTAEGKGTPIGSSMFPAFGKYFMPELSDVYKPDVEKAKALLKEAGYENGFDMTITVPSNYQPHIDVAQVIVEQYKKIGVNAKIQLVEWNSWLSDVYTDRKFESTVIGVDASYLAANALLSRFESTASNNFINFSDAEYDEIYAKFNASTDDAEKTECVKKLEEILTNRAANVYVQDLPEFVAVNKKFTGYQFYPLYVQDIAKLKLAK